ncbi:MAG: DUF3365 domain-containing protein [Pseudomonadota bacterium]|nr:DUF3365 domain-containing protein [Pseudomonadota bacterium]
MKTMKIWGCAVLAGSVALSTGCGGNEEAKSAGVDPQLMADSLFAVMAADRANYTKLIIKRLSVEGEFIKADEHWEDIANGAPLPAQMFRFGAEAVAERTDAFSYSLQSLWPINKQNAPRTEVEKAGLQYIADNPGKNYYAEETLGGVNYYTAVYPDVAVATPCVDCHNGHKDSPRTDFKIGDTMGGVVVRIPLES